MSPRDNTCYDVHTWYSIRENNNGERIIIENQAINRNNDMTPNVDIFNDTNDVLETYVIGVLVTLLNANNVNDIDRIGIIIHRYIDNET